MNGAGSGREARVTDTELIDYLEANHDVYFVWAGGQVEVLTTDHDFMRDPTFARGANLREALTNAAKAEGAEG